MKLNKVQKIILTIGFLLLSFFVYQLCNLYIQFGQFHINNFRFSFDGFNILLFDFYLSASFIILFLTIHLLYLFDRRAKKFNRLQKFGLFLGGLFINYYLVSLIYFIGVYFYNISVVYFPYYCVKFPDNYYYTLFNLFKYILKIIGVSFCSWLWLVIFKNKKNNVSL